MSANVPLTALRPGQSAEITAIDPMAASDLERLEQRLLEMGLMEGAVVEVRHRAPLGGDPIAVAVAGTLIALRRAEAQAVCVRPVSDAGESAVSREQGR